MNNLVLETDPTAFKSLTFVGQNVRKMYDRRPSAWIQNNAWCWKATFDDGLETEVQVNSEFSKEEALKWAQMFITELGRMPHTNRTMMETVWIHKGDGAYGGGNNNVMMHTGKLTTEYL